MILKSRHIVAAVALHLLLFGLLLGGAQCTQKAETVSVIQGRLISANELPREAAQPKPQPPAPEVAPPPAPPPVAPPEPLKPDPAEAKRAQELQQELQKEKEQQAEVRAKDDAKRKADEILAQKQQSDAAARAAADKVAADQAAALKKQTEAEEKKRVADAKAKADAEEKKRVEDLRKSAEAEDTKRAADEKKKKDLQAKLDAEARRLREAELAEALGAEAQQRQGAEISIWGTELQAAIERVWSRPAGADTAVKCVLKINLSATGEVLSASIKTGSGNTLFDDSVIRAVYKASPLPLPRNPSVFQSIINITFIPKN